MQIAPEDIKLIGIGCTFVASIIAAARAYSKIKIKTDEHGEELREIQCRFVSPTGEPLLVSTERFDKIRNEDKATENARHAFIDKKLETHDKKFEQAVSDVAELKRDIATIDTKIDLLLDRREGGGRRIYD